MIIEGYLNISQSERLSNLTFDYMFSQLVTIPPYIVSREANLGGVAWDAH
jgi:hypothetical protein